MADLERRIGHIDGVVEKVTHKGRTGSAMALADQQRKTRAELVAQRATEARSWPSCSSRRQASRGSDDLAALLGAGDLDVLRWFLLTVALLLDPAAVLLLLAASLARR